MSVSLVLTLIGNDRPGLVESVSEILSAHQGNWEESRMASLGGKFAGILLASVPARQADAVTRALEGLDAQGLRVVVERSAQSRAASKYRTLVLDLVGQDHPGIVHDISSALAGNQISVAELQSGCEHASMAGGDLFRAHAVLRVPNTVDDDDLRASLERIANEIMVDIVLDEAEPE